MSGDAASDEPVRAREPFAITAAAFGVVTLAVFRLPGSFVAVLERNALLQGSAAGWALRLLAIVAVAQAAYAGGMILRPERVEVALEEEPSMRAAGSARVARSLSWNAAGIAALTIVYGIASFAVTGERGGFWLFVLIGIAQLAWYYRLTGSIVEWLRFQPRADLRGTDAGGTPPYCPPLARGFLGASVHPQG
jgi:hypothetical protein